MPGRRALNGLGHDRAGAVYADCGAIERLCSSFIDCSLPSSQWTHAAHLTVAVCLLRKRPRRWVDRHLPELIRGYNVSVGTANTDHGGFHATITHFYVRAISSYLRYSTEICLVRQVEELLRCPAGQRDFPMLFYSPGLLFSANARRAIVSPDLRTLRFQRADFGLRQANGQSPSRLPRSAPWWNERCAAGPACSLNVPPG